MKHKHCDRCGSKDRVRLISFMQQFPFYQYESIDLCIKCKEELGRILENFMEAK